MVQYHKYIGGLFFLVCFIHMILWWKVYDLNHMWPENIIAIPSQYHLDNFTIPLMSITFVFLIVFMGLGSIYFIRRYSLTHSLTYSLTLTYLLSYSLPSADITTRYSTTLIIFS